MARSQKQEEEPRRVARDDARGNAREYIGRDARADSRETVFVPRRKTRRELRRDEERFGRGEE